MKIGLSLNSKSCLLLLFTTLLFISATAKDYWRSCNAKFIIEDAYGNRADVVPYSFRAKASAGAYWPNTIRERAYRKARDCLNAAAGSYPDSLSPAKCKTRYILDYPSVRFNSEATDAICREWRLPAGGRTTVKVHGYVWGDQGCGGSTGSMSKKFLIDSNRVLICPR